MNLHTKVGIDVSKTDNGWVLEWKDEAPKRLGSRVTTPFDDERPTRGIEVFTDKAKLLKRIEQLV